MDTVSLVNKFKVIVQDYVMEKLDELIDQIDVSDMVDDDWIIDQATEAIADAMDVEQVVREAVNDMI